MDDVKQVAAPDSPEARKIVLLGGYTADLIEAAEALEIAGTFSGETAKPGSDIHRFLVAHAVIAYARCFANSNVREKLDTIVAIPSQHVDVHQAMMDVRNKTVAHSESTLQVTYASVDLRHVGEETTVERAVAITFSHPIPRLVIEQLQRLITDLRAALQVHFDVAKAELISSLDGTAASGLWDHGVQPRLVPTSDAEWVANARRGKYPASAETPIYVGWLPDDE